MQSEGKSVDTTDADQFQYKTPIHTYEKRLRLWNAAIMIVRRFILSEKYHLCFISTSSTFASLPFFLVVMHTGGQFSTSPNSSSLYFIEFLPPIHQKWQKCVPFVQWKAWNELTAWLRLALYSFDCQRWLLYARRLQNTDHKLGFVWLFWLLWYLFTVTSRLLQ